MNDHLRVYCVQGFIGEEVFVFYLFIDVLLMTMLLDKDSRTPMSLSFSFIK